MTLPIKFLPTMIRESKRPTITLLIGAQGSGKSTWIKNNIPDLTIISTDNLIEEFAKENNITYSEAFNTEGIFEILEKQMKADFQFALKNEKNIVVDRTNMTVKSRNKFLASVPKKYLRFAVIFNVDRDTLLRRVAARNISGKHISPEIVDDTIKKFEYPIPQEKFNEIFIA